MSVPRTGKLIELIIPFLVLLPVVKPFRYPRLPHHVPDWTALGTLWLVNLNLGAGLYKRK